MLLTQLFVCDRLLNVVIIHDVVVQVNCSAKESTIENKLQKKICRMT